MSKIDGYATYQAYYQKGIYEKESPKNGQRDLRLPEKEDVERSTSKRSQLSQGAKELLSEMQKKYSDMDFFVADYSSDEEAQKYLSRGAKDYSVLIEPELLEKMAADENVKEKYLGVMDDAKNKISEAREEIVRKDDDENNGGKSSDIKSLGFSVKADGSLSFFAELEKSSVDQRKRIEQSREEKRVQKKEEEKKAKSKEKNRPEDKIKRSLVHGDSVDELVKNIQSLDWNEIAEERQPKSGGRLDLLT